MSCPGESGHTYQILRRLFMVVQRWRDGPLSKRRDRGRNGSPTSAPRPTQSVSEPVFIHTSRFAGSEDTGAAADGSGVSPDVSATGAIAGVDLHDGFPVFLRLRSPEGRRLRGEAVVVGKPDAGRRARSLEALGCLRRPSDDEGLAGVREFYPCSVPGDSGSAAVEPGCEGRIVSV